MNNLSKITVAGMLVFNGSQALAQKTRDGWDSKIEEVQKRIDDQYSKRLNDIQFDLKPENLNKLPEPMRSEEEKRLKGELERWIAFGNENRAKNAYQGLLLKYRELKNKVEFNLSSLKLNESIIQQSEHLQKTGQSQTVVKAKSENIRLEAENTQIFAEMNRLSGEAKPLQAEYERLRAISEKLQAENFEKIFNNKK